ncbi:hypothetical protein BQ8482_540014 [Mesorhizobium delmotii]|uniref:Uncharacterized protein n=1 Tax=Mesorhizobium delmotii TaxID=1631247 RepID=A0A2P9AUT1_9HYPH|nr:hypothetical protein BQ8482_540014 [Mesorhizobium delmotii]
MGRAPPRTLRRGDRRGRRSQGAPLAALSHRLFDHFRTRLGADFPDRRHQARAGPERPAADAGGFVPVVGLGCEVINVTAQRLVFDALVAARSAAKVCWGHFEESVASGVG